VWTAARTRAPAAGARGAELSDPVLILAADHRARGVLTVENYDRYVESISNAMSACDGILASMQPLRDLMERGSVRPTHKTYLSINRAGLAGSAFELDDRLVASVDSARQSGVTGVKHMVRIDMSDRLTAPALELLGKVLEGARSAGLDAMIEALSWRDGRVARDTESVIFAAVVAHDIGAPLLKVPVPHAQPGNERVEAVARVVESVGVPVLFLGGPRPPEGETKDVSSVRDGVLCEVRDAVEGGAAGVAIGRVVIEDPDPAHMAAAVAGALRGER
jgi:DhnA family fructose-bisphosphate aldolase class Ia